MENYTALVKAALQNKERIQQSLADLDRRMLDGSLAEQRYQSLKTDYQQQMMAAVYQISSIKNSIKLNLEELRNRLNQKNAEAQELRDRYHRNEISTKAYKKEEAKLAEKTSALEQDVLKLQKLADAKFSSQLLAPAIATPGAYALTTAPVSAAPLKKERKDVRHPVALVLGLILIGVMVLIWALQPAET